MLHKYYLHVFTQKGILCHMITTTKNILLSADGT